MLEIIITILAGCGAFLLGFKVLSDNMEKIAGNGLKKLFSTCPALKYAAITDGPGDAFASDGVSIARYTLPPLDYVASPLGCGDTASAVLLSELCSGTELFPAFQRALAAASANCLNPTPGKFSPVDAEKLLPSYTVETL